MIYAIVRLSNHRTDLLRIEFNDERIVYIDLPSNIANAPYREAAIREWVVETFKNVHFLGIDIDIGSQTLSDIMCIRIYPDTHDAYNIYIPGLRSVKDQLPDEIVEEIDRFLEHVNHVQQWVNE